MPNSTQDFSMKTRVLSSSCEKEIKSHNSCIVILALMLLTHLSVLIFFPVKERTQRKAQPYIWDRVVLKVKCHYKDENILKS